MGGINRAKILLPKIMSLLLAFLFQVPNFHLIHIDKVAIPAIVLAAMVSNQPLVVAQTDLTELLFLPLITNGKSPKKNQLGCQFTAEETRMAELLTTTSKQQRTDLACNEQLTTLARNRAEDMAKRHYFAHVNPDGFGPNYLATQLGYELPSFYDQTPTGNNIESIGAGTGSAEAMWNAWMQSEKHITHLLGMNDFFRDQSEYGIGLIQLEGSDYTYYWVLIIAQPKQSANYQ